MAVLLTIPTHTRETLPRQVFSVREMLLWVVVIALSLSHVVSLSLDATVPDCVCGGIMLQRGRAGRSSAGISIITNADHEAVSITRFEAPETRLVHDWLLCRVRDFENTIVR